MVEPFCDFLGELSAVQHEIIVIKNSNKKFFMLVSKKLTRDPYRNGQFFDFFMIFTTVKESINNLDSSSP
tara:strand:- start:3 stop:212 length:210 start_codon:yes stop_codon:yes gene_type:complete